MRKICVRIAEKTKMKSTDVKIGGGGSLDKTNVHRARCGSTGVRIYRSGLCFGLCCVLITLLLFLLTSAAHAGQHIVIDTDVSAPVYGNGTPPNGSMPILPPSDNAADNSVTVNSGGTVGGTVHGGYAEGTSGTAAATGNSVTINGGTVADVDGGYAENDGTATATGNSVTVNSGTVNQQRVYGGHAYSPSGTATATGNSVTVSGGTVNQSVNVIGGYAANRTSSPPSTSGMATATGNSVTVSGGTMGGNVIGGSATAGTAAAATGNTVTVSGGEVRGNVYGGSAANNPSGTAAEATGNTVTVSGGTVMRDVIGGRVRTFTGTGTATHNTVTIRNNPTFGSDTQLLGGLIENGSGNAFTGNTLNLSSTITVGGVENFEFYNFMLPDDMSPVDTMLDVTGTAKIAGSTISVGLAEDAGLSALPGVGSELILLQAATLESADWKGVETTVGDGYELGWKLATKGGNQLTAFLKSVDIAGDWDLPEGYSVKSLANEDVSLSVGGVMTLGGSGLLLDNSADGGLTANIGTLNASGMTLHNTAADKVHFGVINLDGAFTLDGSGEYTAETYNVLSPTTWTGNLNAEGSTMNFVLPTSGATALTVTGTANIDGATIGVDASAIDMLLEAGDSFVLIDATDMVGSPTTGKIDPVQFGATLVYDFGVDVTNNQLLASVESVNVREESKILSEGFLAGSILLNQTGDMIAQRTEQARCGAFFDITFGDSRYNTGSHVDMKGFSLLTGLTCCVNTTNGKMTYGAFFEYGNGNDTGLYVTGARGNSDVYHYGGGVLGRLNLRNSVYAEGSFRAGGVDNGFTSNLLDGAGNAAGYDSSSAYIGTHLGLGRKLKLSSRNTLDLYSKYFWTHQNGDRVTLSTNDPVKFAGIDSHRMRLGGRSNYVVNRRLSTYLGAAWEHEFAGTARATTYGYAIDSPSLRGSTGIGELGVSVKPQRALPLAFDFGVQGYLGKREGVAGSAQVRWAF